MAAIEKNNSPPTVDQQLMDILKAHDDLKELTNKFARQLLTQPKAEKPSSSRTVSLSTGTAPVEEIISLMKDLDLSNNDAVDTFRSHLNTHYDITRKLVWEKIPVTSQESVEIIRNILFFIKDADLKQKLQELRTALSSDQAYPSECLDAIKKGLFSFISSTSLPPDQASAIKKFFSCFENEEERYTLVSGEMSWQVNSYLAKLCSSKFFSRDAIPPPESAAMNEFFLSPQSYYKKDARTYDLSSVVADSRSVHILASFIERGELRQQYLTTLFQLLTLADHIQSKPFSESCRQQIKKGIEKGYTNPELYALYQFANKRKENDICLLCASAFPTTENDLTRYSDEFQKLIGILRALFATVFIGQDGLLTLKIKFVNLDQLNDLCVDKIECLDFSECATVNSATDWIVKEMSAEGCTISKLNLSKKDVSSPGQLLDADYKKLGAILENTKTLTDLDLTNRNIGDEQLERLFGRISDTCSLRTLILEKNQIKITHETFLKISQKPGFKLLTTLNITRGHFLRTYDPEFMKAINGLSALKSLSISGDSNSNMVFLKYSSSIETLRLICSTPPHLYSAGLLAESSVKEFVLQGPFHTPQNCDQIVQFFEIVLTNPTIRITMHCPVRGHSLYRGLIARYPDRVQLQDFENYDQFWTQLWSHGGQA